MSTCAAIECKNDISPHLHKSTCIGCGLRYCGTHLRYKGPNPSPQKFNNQCEQCYNPESIKNEAGFSDRGSRDAHYITSPDGQLYIYFDTASQSYVGKAPVKAGSLIGVCSFSYTKAHGFLASGPEFPNWKVVPFPVKMQDSILMTNSEAAVSRKIHKIIFRVDPVQRLGYDYIGLTLSAPESMSTVEYQRRMQIFISSKDHRLMMKNVDAFAMVMSDEYPGLSPEITVDDIQKVRGHPEESGTYQVHEIEAKNPCI